ncbi:MAG: sulfatase-like hydrolase/transferase [Candidatus Latescibacterota bacterium]
MPKNHDILLQQSLLDRRPLSRRGWLRSVAGATASLAVTPFAALGQSRSRPPNVILILADDLGSRDLGCYGATDLFTDNLDSLAAWGVRFDQFYVTAPACLPSRASLLTGRHPQHMMEHGLGMVSSEVTLAELLRAEGYRTAAFGKWHLGHKPEVSPHGQGFDRFVGFKFGAIDNYSHYYYWGGGARPGLWRDGKLRLESGSYFPDIMTDEAVKFIHTEKDRPFFLYLPYNIPHYPMQPPTTILLRYAHITDPARRFYAACVTAMDECIGRVLQAVGDNDLTQDTIIIFLSDHGHSVEADTMGGGGRSAPFRGGKTTLWEGGIRVPCIVAWPGTLPRGQVRQQPVMNIDLLPTIAEWCGVPLLGLEVDGRSLQPVIDSPMSESPHEFLAWTWQKWSAVRSGPWKYVQDNENTKYLYNLATDPGESSNLIRSHADTARRLIAHRDSWFSELRRNPRTHVWLP